MAATAVTLSAGCSRTWEPEAPEVPRLEMLRGTVRVDAPTGPLELAVDVAATDPERQKGLMFVREPLGDQRGMLFVMDGEEDHGFWMKNTYIPLDMLFLDASGTVAGMVENAEPHTTQSRRAGVPSRFVLEVDAGWARRHGVRAGTRTTVQVGADR